MSEAEDEAARVWKDIGTVLGGAGTFTPEQEDGYAKAIIAAAIQKHIDATAAVTRDRDLEKAERDRVWLQAKALGERVEKAERKLLDIYEGNEPNPHDELMAAEQRLADLVREVREWWDSPDGDVLGGLWPPLETILAKYERPEQ
jgi:hypothetical protein